jgi:hypothetical protein
MYFVGAFVGPAGPSPAALESIVELSMRSSLNNVAWGVVYPDALRTLTPFVLGATVDRAWALEQAWGRGWPHRHETLRQWRDAVAAGQRPALALNTTIVETGQRMVIGTFDRPSTDMKKLMWQDYYGTRDITVLTAARLSATFGYVTPVARASDTTADKWHLADGGYQDNYGVATVVDWLMAALLHRTTAHVDAYGRPCDERLRIAVVRIGSREDRSAPANQGGAFQMVAPLLTLMGISSAGPRLRNEVELALLAHAVKGRLQIFCFDYGDEDSPLSWHLSPMQRRRIRNAWSAKTNPLPKEPLREFYRGGDGRNSSC